MPHAEVDGRKIYYEWHGEERKAEPLVLATGIGGSCRGWLPLQIPEFSKHHPVLIFDHQGSGGSDDSGDAFSTADLAKDLVGLLDALGLSRVHLLGAFMGGMMAQGTEEEEKTVVKLKAVLPQNFLILLLHRLAPD